MNLKNLKIGQSTVVALKSDLGNMSEVEQNYEEELKSLDGQIAYCKKAVSEATEEWEKKEFKAVIEDCEKRKAEVTHTLKNIKNLKSGQRVVAANNPEVEKDLATIRELLQGAKIDQYGQAYVKNLDEAAATYGKHGLQSQVAYILSNSKFSDKEAKKKLSKYASKGTWH